MLLNNGLLTIELGSINWRQVINQNFVYLDNNRIFVVNTTAELPTSNFKANRFFYNKKEKNLWFDSGTALVKLSGGAEIDLVNNANKFIKVNETGTALEYTTINSLVNEASGTNAISIGETTTSSSSVNIGKTTSGTTRSFATESINIGTNSSTNVKGSISIGNNSQIQNHVLSAKGTICIGYNTKSLIEGINNDNGMVTIVGSESFIAGNNSGTNNSYNTSQATIIGTQNKIIGGGNNRNIIIGNGNKINGSGIEGSMLFGNYIESSLTKSIIFSKQDVMSGRLDNSASICYSTMKGGINQKQILEVARTNIISNDFTTNYRYYEDSRISSIKILGNSFFNMKYTINIFNILNIDSKNNKIKTIKGEILGYCSSDIASIKDTVSIKKHTKEVFYEDPEYALADIDFVSSNTNNRTLYFKINTNGILSNISGEIEIKFNSPIDYNNYY